MKKYVIKYVKTLRSITRSSAKPAHLVDEQDGESTTGTTTDYNDDIDDPERLVEVDTRVLKPFDCRLYKILKHDQPQTCQVTRRKFWRSGMTRSMLMTLVRSLQHGQLSLSRGTSLEEALNTFEYENVPIGVPSHRQCEVSMIKNPKAGVAFEKRSERVSEVITRTCEQVAHAIASWPRLEAALDAALHGGPSLCTCTATRAWLRFCTKPKLYAEKGDATVNLARKWPSWCANSLAAIGVVHQRLVADGTVEGRARDAASFDLLAKAVLDDPLGGFFGTALDVPRHSQDSGARREALRGERFANEQRNVTIDSAAATSGPVSTRDAAAPPVPKEAAQFARACLALAETMLHNTASPSTVFSGQCSDEHGKTAERKQLTAALAQRGVKVVRWSDDERASPKPLIFPPTWASDDGSPVGSVHATLLLDFSSLR